jgi:NADH-quinone oxidoreductase subunit M
LWAIQRVYLGAEYKGPHGDHITPSNSRENLIGITLLLFAILFGIMPYQTVLKYMDKTITRQTSDLAKWTRDVKQPELTLKEQEKNAPTPPPTANASIPATKAVVIDRSIIAASTQGTVTASTQSGSED